MRIEEIIDLLKRLENSYKHDAQKRYISDTMRSLQMSYANALHEAIALICAHPDAKPNWPLTEEELLEMDGRPVWGKDGECYIVNSKTGYAADKYRGFAMLWCGPFYRRPPNGNRMTNC